MPPLAIAAGVAAVGTIGGALISSHAQKQASNAAVEAQTNASNQQSALGQQALADQLALGQQSLGQQWQLGQQSLGVQNNAFKAGWSALSPFAANGLAGSNQLNALLGLPTTKATISTTAPDLLAGTGVGTTPVPQIGGTQALPTPQPATPVVPNTPIPVSNALSPTTSQYTPEQIARMRYATY